MLNRPDVEGRSRALSTPAAREQHLPPEGDMLSAEEQPISERERRVYSREVAQPVIDALRAGLLMPEEQHRLFEEFEEVVQQRVVVEVAGMDASTVMMIKRQIQLLNTVMEESLGDSEGSSEYGTVSRYRMDIKDILGMMHKTTQLMAKELPKIQNTARLTAIEGVHTAMVEEFLPREAQDKYLKEMNRRIKDAESGRY